MRRALRITRGGDNYVTMSTHGWRGDFKKPLALDIVEVSHMASRRMLLLKCTLCAEPNNSIKEYWLPIAEQEGVTTIADDHSEGMNQAA